MKKVISIMAICLVALPLLASDVELKYSGPSGQGTPIWYAPKTGVTNMVMTTNGVSVLTLVDGSIAVGDLAVASNKVIIGNSSGVGAAVTLSGDVLSTTAGALTIQDLAVADNDIALADAKIIVGNTGTGSAVTVTGDISINNAGAVTIADLAVADNDIALADAKIIVGNTGTGSAVTVTGDISINNAGAVTIQDLAVDANDIALADARIIVGNTGTGSAVVVSGDVTINNAGAVTITNGAVALAKLETGVQTSLGKADTALQPGVMGANGTDTNAAVAEVTVTNSLRAAQTYVGTWSLTAAGPAHWGAMTSVTSPPTSPMLSEADSSTVVITSDANGEAKLYFTASADTNGYFNVFQRDGAIKSSAQIVIDVP